MGTRLQLGIEYALPGIAPALRELGLAAIKPLPEDISWGKLQSGPDAPIRFEVLDRLFRDADEGGFRQLTLCLRATSPWASRDRLRNPLPKPAFWPHYERWVQAIARRYGNRPATGCQVAYFEVGSEFSTYEPEPVGEYLDLLARTRRILRAEAPHIPVLHAALLTTTAFVGPTSPESYESAFGRMDRRIAHHSLAEIRSLLDHPELFDGLNVHALGAPTEIEELARWLRWESGRRGYTRPLVISDTTPNFLIGWGPATRALGPKNSLGIVVPPATEADRPALARFFERLVRGDRTAETAVRAFVAEDMVQKCVIAAEQGVALLNTAFIEDLHLLKTPLLQAGAGTSAWAGALDVAFAPKVENRKVRGRHPLFYALQQVVTALRDYDTIRRLPTPTGVRLYQLDRPRGPLWIAWAEPERFTLPGATPSRSVALPLSERRLRWEPLRISPTTAAQTIEGDGQQVRCMLSSAPVFLLPGTI